MVQLLTDLFSTPPRSQLSFALNCPVGECLESDLLPIKTDTSTPCLICDADSNSTAKSLEDL